MRVWKILVGILAGLGSLLIAAAQIKPEDALSNLSGWVKKLGLSEVPEWLATDSADKWGTVIGILVILISLIIILTRKERPNLEKTKAPEPTATKAIERDVWLLNAVHYIAYNSWVLVDIPLDEKHLTAGYRALSEIKQKAFDGDLPIWGRVGQAELYKPILKEYWEYYGFEILSFAKDDPEAFCTEKYNDIANDVIYNSLKTSKAKVEELWPLENLDKLVKKTRLSLGPLIRFPELIINMKKELRVSSEIDVLRDIALELRNLAGGKADLLIHLEIFEDDPSDDNWSNIQNNIARISEKLKTIRELILSNEFSDNIFAQDREASLASSSYEFYKISQFDRPKSPSEFEQFKEIGHLVMELSEGGRQSLKQLDNHRKSLENM